MSKYMRGCNPVIQQVRQERLESLYAQDGRHDPAHEHHCTYCGLWAKYGNGQPCDDEPAA